MEVIIATLIIFIGALYSDRTGFWSCDSCCADFISLGPTLCASAHNHVSTDIVARDGFKSLEVNIFLRFKICDSRSYTWDNMGMLLVWISVEQLALWVGISVIVAVILSLSNLKLKTK